MSLSGKYEVVMGLEIHAQLATNSKIFCSCATSFGAEPNTSICPICLGLPGVLPVINRRVVEYALRAGLAMGCSITTSSRFARKNYFYPDLAKGYQITQYEQPLCKNGKLSITTEKRAGEIGITRIHLEEDPAKSIHDTSAGDETGLDFNRSGTPLIEIVSEPDFRSVAEVIAYLTEAKRILQYIGVCDGNMEEGNLRVDANISLRPVGQKEFGTKAEIKNMNSFSNVAKALEYEIKRQDDVLQSGRSISQDTYLWDPDAERTILMRSKEYAHDYRYFPDPDLVPLEIDEAWRERVKRELPELPAARQKRFRKKLGLSPYNAPVITASRNLADYFEACFEVCPNAERVSNWIMAEVMAILNDKGMKILEFPVSPTRAGNLLNLIEKGTISGKIAKTVLEEMLASDKFPEEIVEEQGLVQISDDSELEKQVDDVLAANPKEVAAYNDGKTKLLGFFVGQIMKNTQGKANPQVVNKILLNKLGPTL